MGRTRRGKDEPTIIKKYANRRLYDTGRSSYVTLDDLCEMIKEGHDFVVQDAKTTEDITRSVLTQIIVEQESRGHNLLPTGFLRKLIGFYGNNVQSVVPNYLEQTIDIFIKNQEKLNDQINKSFEGMQMFPGVPALEELNRKNIEMFERTMKMFPPFKAAYDSAENENKAERVKDLKEKIAALQEELKKVSSN